MSLILIEILLYFLLPAVKITLENQQNHYCHGLSDSYRRRGSARIPLVDWVFMTLLQALKSSKERDTPLFHEFYNLVRAVTVL